MKYSSDREGNITTASSRRGILRIASCVIVNLALLPVRSVEAGTTVGPIRSIDSYLEGCRFAEWQSRFAIVDVAAEWCPFCKVIDSQIFTNPVIKKYLQKIALIKVDVTAMDASNLALLQHLKADGPPTVFVIDTSTGHEVHGTRSVGNFDVPHLAGRLRALAA